MKKQFSSSVVFKEIEYEYSAVIYTGDDACIYPDNITDLDRSDGQTIDDSVFDEVEQLALQHALMLEWFCREGWVEADGGQGFSKFMDDTILRITKADGPFSPQTMAEPIVILKYDWSGKLMHQPDLYLQGIGEWIQKNKKKQKLHTDPEPVLKEGVIYSGDNGRLICRKCAGQCALYSGFDLSGQEVVEVPREQNISWKLVFGKDMSCERGCTHYAPQDENDVS